jgi:hypothetical protein
MRNTFGPAQLLALNHLGSALELVNRILDEVSGGLSAFGSPRAKSLIPRPLQPPQDPARIVSGPLKRFPELSELAIAFHLDPALEYPEAWVWLFLNSHHPSWTKLEEELKEDPRLRDQGWLVETDPHGIPWGIQLYRTEPLTRFLAEPDHFTCLAAWFRERLAELGDFCQAHPGLFLSLTRSASKDPEAPSERTTSARARTPRSGHRRGRPSTR